MNESLPQKLMFSGVACACASSATNPLDVIKSRLQVQNEAIKRGGVLKYPGMFSGIAVIAKEEGIVGLWKGLSPSLLREFSYSSMRIGLYDPLRDILGAKDSYFGKVLCGATSGVFAAVLTTPTDLIKVRMMIDHDNSRYKNMRDAFMQTYRSEGLKGLWRGTMPNAQRAGLLTALQLSTYDQTKQFVLKHGHVPDGVPAHLVASFVSGLLTTTSVSPIDVIKTRIMNQKVHADGSKMYKSSLDCLQQIWRNEGPLGLFKGWLPAYLRIGPHFVITFVVLEQLRKVAGMKPL